MHPVLSFINKLSSREKAYFKRINSESLNSKFIKLYSFLILNPETQIDDIKKQFRDSPIAQRPYVELNYLYQHLLRATHIFHLNTKSLTRLLSYAEILIDKKEFKQALKMAKKLKKIAFDKEELEFILNAIKLEGKIKDASLAVRSQEDLMDEYLECSKVTNEIHNIILLKKLKLELLGIQYSSVFERLETLDEINMIEKSLNLITAEPFTFLGKNLWYSVNSLFHQAKNDLDKALTFSLKSIDNTYKNASKTNELDKLKSLNNYLFVCILKNDRAKFYNKYTSFLNLEGSSVISKHHYSYFKIYLRLAIEVKANNKENLSALISLYLEESLTIIDVIPSHSRDELLQILTCACLLNNNYKMALKVWRTWSQYSLTNTIFLIAKLNKIITLFGLNSKQLLKYELINFKKLKKRAPYENKAHEILISFFNTYIDGHQSIVPEKINQIIVRLEEIRHKESEVVQYYELNYGLWLKSLINSQL